MSFSEGRKYKQILFQVCRKLGLFQIARHLTRGDLRILCYHGFQVGDEREFRPQMFMDARLFSSRMKYLQRQGYPVLNLGEAVERLRCGSLPPYSTVITIDDGFFSTWDLAVPALVELEFPASIYVTSYYCVKQTPVFRLTVQYMLWKTRRSSLSLANLGVASESQFNLDDLPERDRVAWQIIEYGENSLDEDGRVELCQQLATALDVDYEKIVEDRRFTIMSPHEIESAVKQGIDIQLHTHRHHLPVDRSLIQREIADNRRILEPIVGRPLNHFCYPSGIHDPAHLEPLLELDIESATTCEVGLNKSRTDPLLLNRFLDGNTITWIEFEAEMSGFAEILRKARSRLQSRTA